MGRDKNERNGAPPRPNGSAPLGQAEQMFYSVWLNDEEREYLRAGEFELSEALDVLQGFVDQGMSLKVGLRKDGQGCYASLWGSPGLRQKDKCLTAYHANAEKALLTLAFGLARRWSDFPHSLEPTGQQSYEW